MPSPADRAERLMRYFETEVSHLDPEHAELWVTDDGSGAAIWRAPGEWSASPAQIVRDTPAMIAAFGRRLPLALRTLVRLERLHPRSPEHWYLHYLGVVPARQGQGLGSALLRPVLERLDAEGLPAFLESSTARSAALYERNGFALTATFDMPTRGPVIRQMWRDPAS
jgi:GNAT superfamily N-acetyltransferase